MTRGRPPWPRCSTFYLRLNGLHSPTRFESRGTDSRHTYTHWCVHGPALLFVRVCSQIGKPGLPKEKTQSQRKTSQGHKSLSSLEVQLTPATELRGGSTTRRSADSTSTLSAVTNSVSFVNRDEDREEEERIKALASIKASAAKPLASFTTAADETSAAGVRRPPAGALVTPALATGAASKSFMDSVSEQVEGLSHRLREGFGIDHEPAPDVGGREGREPHLSSVSER